MAFTVSLNGNNYISEKRKSKFEKALDDGQKVEMGGNGQKPPAVEPTATNITQNVQQEAPPVAQDQSQSKRDYARLFETLELGLKQSYGHQSETLRVHQQYLRNQAEYANIFSQLMQQQGQLFSNGNSSPEKAELTLAVLKSLAQSIEQFHQHQTATLNVHNQFLSQQSAYSQAFVQLLSQQVNGSNGKNGSHETHSNMDLIPPIMMASQPLLEPVEPVLTYEAPRQKQPLPAKTLVKPVLDDEPTPPTFSNSVETESNPVSVGAVDSQMLSEKLLSIVSDKTGYPVEMLELDMDMEADLGIDSIKRVEILGALQDETPDLPEIDTEVLSDLRTLAQIINYVEQNAAISTSHAEIEEEAVPVKNETGAASNPTPAGRSNSGEIKASLLNIVSDKTGYPAEMLELDMDMEADLGIDSIKRVEILGALQDEFPEMPEIDADKLAELRTLQQILDYIDAQGPAEKKV